MSVNAKVKTELVTYGVYTPKQSLKYSVSLDTFSNPDYDYRMRMFFSYDGVQSYTTVGNGLMASSENVSYDDWHSTFRPPRIDSTYSVTGSNYSNNFNTEILTPLQNGDNEIVYYALCNGEQVDVSIPSVVGTTINVESKYNVSGASLILPMLGEITNPTSVLIERCDNSVKIKKAEYKNGVVYITCSEPHNFNDGDAITISGFPGGSTNHIMGDNNERFNGTFVVAVTSVTEFTYQVIMYGDKTSAYYAPKTAVAEKWVAVTYTDECTVGGSAAGMSEVFVTIKHPERFVVGDVISLVGPFTFNNAEIVSVESTGVKIKIAYILSDNVNGDYKIVYSPRVPSASIPVNYPYDEDADDVVLNNPLYYHMSNTFMSYPVVDTYFSSFDGRNHDLDLTLNIGVDSYAALKFSCGFIPNAGGDPDNSLSGCSAKVEAYVRESKRSNAALVLKQITSNDWVSGMSWNEMNGFVTDNIISSATIANLRCTDKPLGYITFDITPDVVEKWLNDAAGYASSVAIATSSDGTVVLDSLDSVVYPPSLIISGGEKSAVNPDTIPITTANGNGDPGDTIRIYTGGGGSFNGVTYNNVVMFNDVKAIVVSGTKTYIDVIIPNDVNGDCYITVYNLQPDGQTLIPMSDPYKFYVNGEMSRRIITLADKIDPGVDGTRVSKSAVYNRDLSYSNFAEVTDGNSMLQNIASCILTNKGERLFNPLFGTTIESRLFSLAEFGGELEVLKECIAAINKYEPRVTVDEDGCNAVFQENGELYITIAVILPSGNHEELNFTFKTRGVKL